MAPMQVALFDLDGTITRHDTLFPYVMRVCLRHPGRLLRVLRRMPGALLRYAFAGRDRGVLKQALIVSGLGGLSRAEISRWNEKFVARLVARGLHPEALTRIREHRADGDYLVLMSASPDIYVPAVARALGFNETICTGVRWEGMILRGELVTPNRRGEEKRQCVEMLRTRHPGRKIEGYGNSASDLAHLEACDRAHLVNANDAASREAAHHKVEIGWPLPRSPQRGA
jgi:phosphatidylglycerophosphatase C